MKETLKEREKRWRGEGRSTNKNMNGEWKETWHEGNKITGAKVRKTKCDEKKRGY